MENVHNINLHSLEQVKKWDTKRVLAYKARIQKHISFLESNKIYNLSDKPYQTHEFTLTKFRNYKEQLKKILVNREHID